MLRIHTCYPLLVLSVLTLTRVHAQDIVHFPDPALDHTFRHALGWPDNVPIPKREVLRLTRLNDRGIIADLTGIEHATNLRSLTLTGNDIYDISLLSGLTKLERLLIQGNPIQDISPLSNLTNLRVLNLGNIEGLVDISPLAVLTRLEHLNLSECETIVDITPLASLTQLQILSMDNNQIIDISPIRHLTNLTLLSLRNNRIADMSPISNLDQLDTLDITGNRTLNTGMIDEMSIQNLSRDEICVVPRPSIENRMANRSMPSTFFVWDDFDNTAVTNDIWWNGGHFRMGYIMEPIGNGRYIPTIAGNLPRSMEMRANMDSQNPNMLYLAVMRQSYSPISRYPDDWFGWQRDANGNRIFAFHNHAIIDYTSPEVQEFLVEHSVAHAKCGLYDGIMFDAWGHDPNLPEDQQLSLLGRIRERVPDDFLILFRVGGYRVPDILPYANGAFMETVPSNRVDDVDLFGYTRKDIMEIEDALMFYEANLREPRINCLKGHSIDDEEPYSPNNLRQMRLFTTMSLTLSNGYVAYPRAQRGSDHMYYPFQDVDLGQPVSDMAHNYQDIDGLYIREFTNGWAIYNRTVEDQTVQLPSEALSVRMDETDVDHVVPYMDGDIFLKTADPADVNGDGIVNILDLVIVANSISDGDGGHDVNGDGVVNVFDLVMIANALE